MLATINTNILSNIIIPDNLADLGNLLTPSMGIVIAVILIPVILGLLMAKKYNALHGLVTFIFVTYLLAFLSAEIRIGKGDVNIFHYIFFDKTNVSDYIQMLNNVLNLPMVLIVGGISKIPGTATFLSNEYASYILMTAVALLFIVCQVIASTRKARKLF